MTPTSIELLDLVARWIHVIAAIMWIGNSLLFNWLDRNLRQPTRPAQTREPAGTAWLLHSGGFYYVEKSLLTGESLPAPLHWFRWQAYTTWWSGVALLLIVYYAGGRALLTDPGNGALTHAQGVFVGVGAITGGLLIYELIQRYVAPRGPRLAVALWIAGLVALSVALTQLLSGRAAFLHIGAMLATIMAANVVLTIVPAQRILVASVARGEGGDPAVSARAKRVSIHNNYFTFPVIALMLSGHFPALYGHRLSWLISLVLVAGGAAVRHVLNNRFAWPRWRAALATAILLTVGALWGVLAARAPATSTDTTTGPVSFAEARHVIDRRCGACHSAHPGDPSVSAAPGGVMFDTPAQIMSLASRIRDRAVVTRTMPAGNKTLMTDAERALLGRWVEQGARLQ